MAAADITYRYIKDQLRHENAAMVDIDLQYPQAETPPRYGKGAEAFNQYYRAQAATQLKYARTELYPEAVRQYEQMKADGYPFNPYTYMQRVMVTLNRLPLVSLYTDLYEYTGGAHGNTVRTGNTWDLEQGRMLTLASLFRPGYDYRTVLIKEIEEQALRRQASGEGFYFDDLAANILKYFDPANFYLTESGLAVFYPLYTISPYVAGINVFEIPYGLFGNNLVYPLIYLP